MDILHGSESDAIAIVTMHMYMYSVNVENPIDVLLLSNFFFGSVRVIKTHPPTPHTPLPAPSELDLEDYLHKYIAMHSIRK